MPLSVTNESKNNLTVTNEQKPTGGTWADFPVPWNSVATTWGQPGTAIVKEQKNNLTITNESKT